MLSTQDIVHAAMNYRIRMITVAAAVLTVIALGAPASAVAATVPRPAAGQVAGLSTTTSGTLNVFYESADHSLMEMSHAQGRWSSPQSLGGVLTSGPAAIAFGPPANTSYVFARGTDDAIWYRASAGGGPWSRWASLGGKALGAPTVSSGVPTHNNATSPVVWVRGADGALWQLSNPGGRWQSLGGRLASDPAASPFGGAATLGLAVVAALGTDHAVWAYLETDAPAGHPGWYLAGGRSTVAPAVSSPSELLARGTDNALWLTRWNPLAPHPGTWQRAGGVLTSPPTATTYPGQAPYVVALGTDGNLWQGTPPASGTAWTWTQIP